MRILRRTRRPIWRTITIFARHALFFTGLALFAQQQGGAKLTLSEITAMGASVLTDADLRSYYLYVVPEKPEGVVVAYQSEDLRVWRGPTQVFQVPADGWARRTDGVRDPRVFAYRGKYFLFVTLFHTESVLAKPPASWRINTRQGVQAFVSDSPLGPFVPAPGGGEESYTPRDFVSLAGSLHVEGDLAWLVYVHDWTQIVDAAIEAVRLKADLSAATGDPIHLFKASDAPWLKQQTMASREPRYYPASGPMAYRTRSGDLLMLWCSLKSGKPVLALARSLTGKLRGPWRQDAKLLLEGAAQPSIFRTLQGQLMLSVVQPVPGAQGKVALFELHDTGATVRVRKRALD